MANQETVTKEDFSQFTVVHTLAKSGAKEMILAVRPLYLTAAVVEVWVRGKKVLVTSDMERAIARYNEG